MNFTFKSHSNGSPPSAHHHTNHIKITNVSKLLNHDQCFVTNNPSLNFNYSNMVQNTPAATPSTPSTKRTSVYNYEYPPQALKTPVLVQRKSSFDKSNRNDLATTTKSQRRLSSNNNSYFETSPRFINNFSMRGGGGRMVPSNSKRFSKKLDQRLSARISDSDDSDDNRSILFSSELNYANKPVSQPMAFRNRMSSESLVRGNRAGKFFSIGRKKSAHIYDNHSRFRSPSSQITANKRSTVEINYRIPTGLGSRLNLVDSLTANSKSYLPYLSSSSSSDSVQINTG